MTRTDDVCSLPFRRCVFIGSPEFSHDFGAWNMNEPQQTSEVAAGFLKKAEEATAEADAATDVFIRASWLKIATCYRELAERFHPRRTKTLNL